MLSVNMYSLLPFKKEDFSAIVAQGCYCYPLFDPTQDEEPVSLDVFFCNSIQDEKESHFTKTYKLIGNHNPSKILALVSLCNSSFEFISYDMELETLRGSGFNDAFPTVMLVAFGVRYGFRG